MSAKKTQITSRSHDFKRFANLMANSIAKFQTGDFEDKDFDSFSTTKTAFDEFMLDRPVSKTMQKTVQETTEAFEKLLADYKDFKSVRQNANDQFKSIEDDTEQKKAELDETFHKRVQGYENAKEKNKDNIGKVGDLNVRLSRDTQIYKDNIAKQEQDREFAKQELDRVMKDIITPVKQSAFNLTNKILHSVQAAAQTGRQLAGKKSALVGHDANTHVQADVVQADDQKAIDAAEAEEKKEGAESAEIQLEEDEDVESIRMKLMEQFEHIQDEVDELDHIKDDDKKKKLINNLIEMISVIPDTGDGSREKIIASLISKLTGTPTELVAKGGKSIRQLLKDFKTKYGAHVDIPKNEDIIKHTEVVTQGLDLIQMERANYEDRIKKLEDNLKILVSNHAVAPTTKTQSQYFNTILKPQENASTFLNYQHGMGFKTEPDPRTNEARMDFYPKTRWEPVYYQPRFYV